MSRLVLFYWSMTKNECKFADNSQVYRRASARFTVGAEMAPAVQ